MNLKMLSPLIMASNSGFKGLMNLTMLSSLIMAYNSSFRRILHNSFSFTGPYIFRKIFLSNTANAMSHSISLASSAQFFIQNGSKIICDRRNIHSVRPPPDGATARGGPWPPLQRVSKPLDPLL